MAGGAGVKKPNARLPIKGGVGNAKGASPSARKSTPRKSKEPSTAAAAGSNLAATEALDVPSIEREVEGMIAPAKQRIGVLEAAVTETKARLKELGATPVEADAADPAEAQPPRRRMYACT